MQESGCGRKPRIKYPSTASAKGSLDAVTLILSRFWDKIVDQPAAVASALFVKKVAALVFPLSIHSAQCTAAAPMPPPWREWKSWPWPLLSLASHAGTVLGRSE